MLRPYPAHFDTIRPERYSRAQVALRFAVLILLVAIGASIRWLSGVLYLAIPIAAAVLLAQGNGTDTREPRLQRMMRALRALVAFLAWLAFLTDRFPTSEQTANLRYEITPEGTPTVASALLRLFTSIPAAIFASILWFVAGLIGVIEALLVLVQEQIPPSLYDVQRGIVRCIARLTAYHASLVDTYPPFAFDTGPDVEQMAAA